jgi:hypothetical protein
MCDSINLFKEVLTKLHKRNQLLGPTKEQESISQ